MTGNELKITMMKLFSTLSYITNLLVTKSVGILVLSILLYYFSYSLGLGQPYNFSELMLWLGQLPEHSKTTVLTSIITISGFLIAFNISSESQKKQLMSQMKIEACNDIESFFNKVSRNITSANIYAKHLVEIANYINNEADEDTIQFHLKTIIEETKKYHFLRQEIQEQAVEVHRFQGKYSIIFASSWGVIKKLETAVEAFCELTEKTWFNTPILRFNDPDIKNKYLRQVDIEKCNNYINAYENNFGVINGATGSLRGGMLGSITGLNLSLIINLLKIDAK